MPKLKIGLTMRIVETKEYYEPRDALAHDWPPFMHHVLPEAQWMPMPNIGSAIVEYAQQWGLNGFIITGGNNLFEYPARDKTEIALIEYALDHALPIFGVCRGFQIMAHYFGYEIKPCQAHAGTRHEVSMDDNTCTVNSYHDNCGPQEISPPLVVLARDADGHIEAFYHNDSPLMACMWHPEREKAVAEFDKVMIRNLFNP